MSRSLIFAAVLFAASMGGAFAQQVSTPTIWGAPYHGPASRSDFGAEPDRGAERLIGTANRGEGRMMSLDLTETIKAQRTLKHHR